MTRTTWLKGILLLSGALFAAQQSAEAANPVLVVTSSGNPFTSYYAEILRAEGLNAFDTADVSTVSSAGLSAYDVVILGEVSLTSAQVATLSTWVDNGGNLIAMRPDKQLASLLGLSDAGTTLSNGYLAVNTSSAPGTGIVSETIQFHGTADRYILNGATAVAMLYSSATTALVNPAVSLRTGIGAGGSAAAFTYDLARSVVLTRQGNPNWVGQARMGTAPPIRSGDLFYGAAPFDPQPNWVDLNKILIPQADEQQRLLVNLIQYMNASKKPLPRFWYLPFGKKAAVVMTGDDHDGNATANRFDDFSGRSPAGCSLENWECIRATSYIYPDSPMRNDQIVDYTAQGFEVAVHLTTFCQDFTATSLENDFSEQLTAIAGRYPGMPAPVTSRTHCIPWSDWDSHAKVERNHGIRLDTNYYHWPPAWLANFPGFMTGSGFPMRFAQTDGRTIDIYQAATQMTDESGQSYPATVNTLLDNAVGAPGYYGVFTANMHNDETGGDSQRWADQVVDAAKARGVPVVSAKQMLAWLDGRNGSSFNSISWSANVLSFSVSAGAGANGLQAMLPTTSAAGTLVSITRNGSNVPYETQVVKGILYAFFPASAGNYQASYSASAPPVISSVTAAPGATGATITWITNKSSDSRVDYGTTTSLGSTTSAAALVTSHSITLSGLTAGTTYFYRVSSTDGGGNTGSSPVAPATASFTTTDSTPPVITGLTVTPHAGGSATITWTTSKPANSRVDYGPTSSLGTTVSDTNLVTAHTMQLTGLTAGTVYSYRVTSVDAFGNSAASTIATFLESGTATVWDASAVPDVPDGGDGDAVEVGMKFRSDAAGYVTGIRFYKAAANTGTHTGNLWSTGGALLGTVTFTGETASGWQQANFAAPVAINANTTYIVSYFAPNGHYSYGAGAFAGAGVDNPPLHALQSGVDGPNGVFRYGASSAFPDQGTGSSNYWVDLAFADTIGPVISAVSVTPTLTSATITWTTNVAATSRVDYGTSTSLGTTASDAALVTSHSVTLNGLTAGTTYYFRVTSVDGSGASATSPAAPGAPATFAAGSQVPPVISGVAAAPAATSATISWTTDKSANSRVDYGTTTSLGSTVSSATLTTAHSVTLTGLATGTTYFFRVTSADGSGASASSPVAPATANFTTTIASPALSIWAPTVTPTTVDSDTDSVELGMKFRSDVAGTVTGVRFYKAAANTGTHTGHLWSSTGALLASVTFSGETASGWQQANFTTPVAIAANTTYVVSYHAPNGRYSANTGFFTSAGVDNTPLHALRSGVDGPNGVYVYGTAIAFPNQTFQDTNYWVDVVFSNVNDTNPPVVSAFTIPATSNSLQVPISSFTATDDVGVAGYLATESATAPLANNTGWTATPPTSYTFTTAGSKTLYGWAKDVGGNVSASRSAAVVITLTDTAAPTVTAFTIPSTSSSLTTPITTFTATDNVAVTGYMVTESATPPSAGAAGWTTSAPASYTFTTAGTKTLFAWARDAAGNVSSPLSGTVTVTVQGTGPEAGGWYAGDIHVHRSCGSSPEALSSLLTKMGPNNLALISLLADSGNAEVQNATTDLPLVNGSDASISTAGRIVHWDTEWHWDAIYTQYAHQALGGHVVALGLTEAHQIWTEYTGAITDWAHQQGAIAGFAHMQYLSGDGSLPQDLTCCTPIEFPVEVALGGADFISEDVDDSGASFSMYPDNFIAAYYRLLNAGFRPGFAAGTDYPCNNNRPLGALLTYAQPAGNNMTYRNWVDAIAKGRTVVSRNGHNEFLSLAVNGTATPGDEIRLAAAGSLPVTVQWSTAQSMSGTIELVSNGSVVASSPLTAAPGAPAVWTTSVTFPKSGWLAARRMGADGHQIHTAAVFVLVNDAPIRASAADAQFYATWINSLISKTSSGGVWNSFFPTSLSQAQARYRSALAIFQQIAAEAAGGAPAPVLTAISPASGNPGNVVAVTLTGTNLYGGRINPPAGVTVLNTTTTATQIKANLSIASNAGGGAQNITVTTMNGTSNAVTFTIGSGGGAPTLTAVSPASGLRGTTVPVTLTGTNFATGATVAVSGTGVTVSGVTVVSATQITANFVIGASATTGARNVTVTTTGGTTGAVTFTVSAAAAPTLTAVNPASGVRGTTVPVTLTGTNFVSGATVAVSGTGVTVSGVT
ncbi:MAG: DUF4082 domain-containing protein, partial [Acidobacteriota bacterium]